MRPVKFDAKDVLAPFYHHRVLTKEQHLRLCGCSAMTAWRAMSEHGYLSSYNQNAKYYTLVDIPEFDEQGLWSYRDIRFSRFGSLPRTMSEMIQRSASGMSAREVEHALILSNARATLARLSVQGKLKKEKLMGQLVYFSPDPRCHQQQRRKRETAGPVTVLHTQLPGAEQIIAVLVEKIQCPGLSIRRLARRLQRKQVKISTKEIEVVFVHYGLEKKSSDTVGVAH